MRARSGLEAFKVVGSGGFRGAAQKDGLFGGAAIIVNGTAVYTLTEDGVLTVMSGAPLLGDTLVDIAIGQNAALNSVARFATGSALYKLEDGVVSLEDFPEAGGAGASSVCYHRSYWAASEAGTDKFYYQIPGDTTWGALEFASSEYDPDPLVALRSRGDQIASLNASSFEVLTLSSDASNPIVPYGGLSFDHGCRSRDTAVNCKGSLLYVDNECNVRRWDGGEPTIVSDPGQAEQIASVAAGDLRAWTYAVHGHRFYVLSLGAVATWVYDLTAAVGGDRWFNYNSLGYDYWRPALGCSIGGTVLACDRISAQVYRLDPTLRLDNQEQFQVKFCAMIDGEDVPIPCANVTVLCDLGDVPMEGDGSEPLMLMRMSDNQGKTFGPYMDAPLATTGDYTTLPVWNGLGDIPQLLGRIFEFSVSDPVGRTFKRVAINLP